MTRTRMHIAAAVGSILGWLPQCTSKHAFLILLLTMSLNATLADIGWRLGRRSRGHADRLAAARVVRR